MPSPMVRPPLYFVFDAAGSPREEYTVWEGNAALRRQLDDRHLLGFGKVFFLGKIGAGKVSLVAALDLFVCLVHRNQITLELNRPTTTQERTVLARSLLRIYLVMNHPLMLPAMPLLCKWMMPRATILMTTRN